MTIPFFVEDPTTLKQIQVPYDIVRYCDDFTVDSEREDLRYVDCIWMHMGYYGTPPNIMKAVRDEHFNRTTIHPVFE